MKSQVLDTLELERERCITIKAQSVALNSAAGLIVSGKENTFKNAYDKATKHLNSGKVFEHLTKLQSK